MKASELKKGSVIEIEVNFNPEKTEKTKVTIDRVTDYYVWFKHSGFFRVGRNTIDRFPILYKIISI